MIAKKVCPVVLRSIDSKVDVLAFEHPLAGYQLIKGTVEVGESTEAAALRELAEESGILSVNVTKSLGIWSSGFQGQVWEFFLCGPTKALPETWLHYAPDDGGHIFRLFWHPLFADADSSHWHPLFHHALRFIQGVALKNGEKI